MSLLGRSSLWFPSPSFAKAQPKLKGTVNLHYKCNSSLKISSCISTPSTGVGGSEGSHSSPGTCSKPNLESSPYLSQINDEKYTKAGLRKELVPKHVAVILDGSRRWLKARGEPLNYMPFFQTNAHFADLCLKWGVGTATTFIYSYDNLHRGKEANDLIFGQLERFLGDNLENFIRKQIHVILIGERNELPKSLQDMVKQVEEATRRKPKAELTLRLAVCYTGTRDILQATRSLCEKSKAGAIEINKIDEVSFDRELSAGGAPRPELLIRTGGEIRLSNYLMWNLALTDFYFIPILAPEFTEDHFLDALRSYQERDKRFGR